MDHALTGRIVSRRASPAATPIARHPEATWPVERTPGGTSLIDVLDRILDKGIVVDAWVRISLVGIDLLTVEARVVIASIDTYLKYAEAVGITTTVARPAQSPKSPGDDDDEPPAAAMALVPR